MSNVVLGGPNQGWWVGSRWWKFDFHCHTPTSDDYGKGPNQDSHKQIAPDEWLLAYMRAGIDCVAITDHNSGAWIDALKQSLSDLATAGHPDYRPLHIFPGVEITVAGNIHVLAIFSCNKGTADIDSLLGAVKYRDTKGKSDGCSEASFVEVLEEISRSGGLAIPAHVDQPRGLFAEFTGNTLEQALTQRTVVAIEVVDLSTPKPALYTSKKLKWAEVLGADSHHPTGTVGQRFPGSHFTWIKMSEPSLDGLRLALMDGELSVRRSDQFVGNPNSHCQMAIESIEIDTAKYLGRGTPFVCKFNPWLNTIIGGRGTGKSTILEFLRIALMRREELPRTLATDFAKYQQASSSRDDEGLLTQVTKLTVYFQKDGRRFRIAWSNSPVRWVIEEHSSSDAGPTWGAAEGDVAQRFPIRIYSQKQIFEIAKHPNALLQIIDDAPEVNYRDWRLEWDELVSKYLSIRAQMREVEAGLQEEAVVKGQLSDVVCKLEVFESAGHATVLKAYQEGQSQEKAIRIWEALWEDAAQQVAELAATLGPADVGSVDFKLGDGQAKDELMAIVANVCNSFDAIRSDVSIISARIKELRRYWTEAKAATLVTRQISEARDSYNALLGHLSTAGAGDPSGYSALVTQRHVLEDKLKGFGKKREIVQQHSEAAEECLEEIYIHRAKITALRADFLRRTLSGNPYVKIDVSLYGNTDTAEEELRRLLDRSSGFDRDIGGLGSGEGILSLLSPNAQQPAKDRIENVKIKLRSLYVNDDAAVAEAKDKRFVSHVQSLAPEQMDRLNCWFPGDSLEVRYSLKDGANFKPVEQGSPGQKTAALLAFILSYGDEPLILDQPEDDLDNHLIYDLIVAQLRAIKHKRQIMIVTHNANIVVNGDSENVAALDVRNGQTKIVTQGGLQDFGVREEICRVMEGGKEAFEQRYRRIAGANA